jgi:hypothetical protein
MRGSVSLERAGRLYVFFSVSCRFWRGRKTQGQPSHRARALFGPFDIETFYNEAPLIAAGNSGAARPIASRWTRIRTISTPRCLYSPLPSASGRSTSRASCLISSAALLTGTDLAISSSTCSAGKTLTKGASCTVGVTFKPHSQGSKTDTLAVRRFRT